MSAPGAGSAGPEGSGTDALGKTIEITRYEPPAQYRPQGRRVATTWRAVFDEFRRPIIALDKADVPGWSPATFTGDRRGRDRVEQCHAVGVDDDEAPLPLEAAVDHWRAVLGPDAIFCLHTTHSATPEAPRYRFVAPCSRPIMSSEYDALWHRLERRSLERGHPIGTAAKDPSRFWYAPSTPRVDWFRAVLVVGEFMLLDVDRILAEEREAAKTERRPRIVTSVPIRSTSRARAEYVLGALHAAARQITSAAPGARNDLLNRQAFALARFVVAGQLSSDAIRVQLGAAAIQAGLEQREVRATIESALRSRTERKAR